MTQKNPNIPSQAEQERMLKDIPRSEAASSPGRVVTPDEWAKAGGNPFNPQPPQQIAQDAAAGVAASSSQSADSGGGTSVEQLLKELVDVAHDISDQLQTLIGGGT